MYPINPHMGEYEDPIARFRYLPRDDSSDSREKCAVVEIDWKRPGFLSGDAPETHCQEYKTELADWMNKSFRPEKFLITVSISHLWYIRFYGQHANANMAIFKLRWGDTWEA